MCSVFLPFSRRREKRGLAALDYIPLTVNQPEVAKIEKRADMLLSTPGAVLRAMGAELKIVASFPKHDIQIRSLSKPINGKRNRRSAARRNAPVVRGLDP